MIFFLWFWAFSERYWGDFTWYFWKGLNRHMAIMSLCHFVVMSLVWTRLKREEGCSESIYIQRGWWSLIFGPVLTYFFPDLLVMANYNMVCDKHESQIYRAVEDIYMKTDMLLRITTDKVRGLRWKETGPGERRLAHQKLTHNVYTSRYTPQ